MAAIIFILGWIYVAGLDKVIPNEPTVSSGIVLLVGLSYAIYYDFKK